MTSRGRAGRECPRGGRAPVSPSRRRRQRTQVSRIPQIRRPSVCPHRRRCPYSQPAVHPEGFHRAQDSRIVARHLRAPRRRRVRHGRVLPSRRSTRLGDVTSTAGRADFNVSLQDGDQIIGTSIGPGWTKHVCVKIHNDWRLRAQHDAGHRVRREGRATLYDAVLLRVQPANGSCQATGTIQRLGATLTAYNNYVLPIGSVRTRRGRRGCSRISSGTRLASRVQKQALFKAGPSVLPHHRSTGRPCA